MELGVAGGRRTGFALREFVVAASRRWWVRGLAALVAGVVVVVTLRGRAPEPGEILAALRATDARWFAVAVLLQQLSQAAFGRQQRVMLAAFGVRMSRPVALAVAYARSAISLAFPAGSAMSAAYAMGQYRRRGATAAAAATTMVLSGAASVGGLLLAYAAVAGSMVGLRQPALAVVVLLCLVAVVPVVVGAVRARVHHESRIAARLPAAVGRVLREVRTVRPRELGVTVAFAVLNWLLDLACLAAAARGVGFRSRWRSWRPCISRCRWCGRFRSRRGIRADRGEPACRACCRRGSACRRRRGRARLPPRVLLAGAADRSGVAPGVAPRWPAPGRECDVSNC
ncbi:lysylphosphatidylglycerol synthase domain-containing protein [Paractinoplanes durhamensis]|uniref:lysylphosphatidylglycerol synthase domain-containing protein n=1 Tax=Paractinoplanes durhamensis TaxID=113563 RepID=UPI003634BDAA